METSLAQGTWLLYLYRSLLLDIYERVLRPTWPKKERDTMQSIDTNDRLQQVLDLSAEIFGVINNSAPKDLTIVLAALDLLHDDLAYTSAQNKLEMTALDLARKARIARMDKNWGAK